MNELEQIIKERHNTHGVWQENVPSSTRLARSLRDEYFRYCKFTKTQPNDGAVACLFNVGTKLSRMIWGDPNFKDHHQDLTNYMKFFKEFRNERKDVPRV